MLNLLKSFVHPEFLAECGRLLLLAVSASYVGANVRRLALKHGWDHHLLYLVLFIGTAQRWTARGRRMLWLSIGSGGGLAVAITQLASRPGF
jgi:hypothetical protein